MARTFATFAYQLVAQFNAFVKRYRCAIAHYEGAPVLDPRAAAAVAQETGFSLQPNQ